MTEVKFKDRSGRTLTVVELDGKYFPPFPVDNLKNYRNLPLKADDVLLCAYPKSGTHWLWEVMMMLLKGKAETIPMLNAAQMLEYNTVSSMEAADPPRVFNTHVLYEDLPHAALEPPRATRLVLVLRNPKDVAVSYYHHLIKLGIYEAGGTFADFLELFLEGKVVYGSWFDYMKSWEKVLNAKDVNPIHVLTYEDMKEDPVRETKRLAEFLGLNLDPELIKQVADKCDFAKMAEDKKAVEDHADIMYRKGVVGDWKNAFTVAQNEHFDAIYEEKMKGCKLMKFSSHCELSDADRDFYF